MKILVTGGAGFIGSNFIHWMIENHPFYKIINLDKLTYAGNLDNLKDIEKNANYKFVKGDICDAKIVNTLIKGVDAVLNFAAETHVDRSISDAAAFIKTDVFGAYVLLEAVKKHNTKRFIQISTDEVYGSVIKGSFKETDMLNPTNPYSASKAGAELLVNSYRNTFKLPVIVTRSSNIFGPYQYPEKMMPLFITNAIEGKPLPLYGDGKNVRDWLYVKDNCRGIDLVLHKGRDGQIYNISGGNETQNIKLTRTILSIMGKPESLIKPVRDRLGHDRRYSIDSGKIRKELGWKPEQNFRVSLEDTVKWYVNNKSWWRKLKK
jgi:dTDP-glucose 4,6-dehydratase